MALQHLDQARARDVVGQIATIRDEPDDRGFPRDLAILAKGFPAQIIQNGLGQALAFLKCSRQRRVHGRLYGVLQTWLCHGATHLPWESREEDLLERLVNQSSPVYRAVADEALAYLNWFRRLAAAEAPAAESGKEEE